MVRGKRRRDELQRFSLPVCTGAVFGTFLGSLVAILAVDGLKIAFVVRVVKALLLPVAKAVADVRGADARVLCLGLAAGRPLRQQMEQISVADAPPQLHTSLGHSSTIVGACASVFVLFAFMTTVLPGGASPERVHIDVVWLLDSACVERVLDIAIETVQHGVPNGTDFEMAAAESEERALGRARAGVLAARAHASSVGMPVEVEFRLLLAWFSRAAWPAGEVVGARTHDALMRRIVDGSFFMAAPTRPPAPQSFVDVVPLSQLVDSHGRQPTESESDSVSISSRATGSAASAASAASLTSLSEFAQLSCDTRR